MKKIFLISLSLAIAFAQLTNEETEIVKKIAVQAHDVYAKTLRKAMKSKLEKEGAAKAIEYCYNNANFLTMTTSSKLSRKLKVKIKLKRISLKNRNPYNYPNMNDIKIIKAMEEKKPSSEELIIKDDKKAVHSYQALYVKKICLKCHGSNLGEDVKKALKKYYGNDKAVNYKEGDFRGAIVVTIDKKSLKKHIENKILNNE